MISLSNSSVKNIRSFSLKVVENTPEYCAHVALIREWELPDTKATNCESRKQNKIARINVDDSTSSKLEHLHVSPRTTQQACAIQTKPWYRGNNSHNAYDATPMTNQFKLEVFASSLMQRNNDIDFWKFQLLFVNGFLNRLSENGLIAWIVRVNETSLANRAALSKIAAFCLST